MIFTLHSVNVVCQIYNCLYVEPFLHVWDKSHLIPVNVLLNVVFVVDFYICVHQEYCPVISFSLVLLPDFGIKVMLAK